MNAPKKTTWYLGLLLAVAALVVKFTGLASADVAFWLALASSGLLLLGTLLTNL